MESKVTNVQRELYFLIAKFLKSGPCQEAAKVLQDELEKNEIVEKRLDWEGEEHAQAFADMEKKYPHIGPNHLEEICCRLGPLLDKEIKPTVPGLKSLLGAGGQSLLRTKDIERQFFTLLNYVARKHGVSVYSPNTITNHNVVHALLGQSISGPASKRHLLTPKLFSKVRLLNRTLGHLSAVYCLLFDRTGRYIATGADDLLVKVWSAVDGRLLNSFRGTSAEITDIDINTDNTLLAAGSLDKTIRVWCMQSGYPVAILSSHTGAITGVNFWPNSVDECSYLVSTSSDGSIAFWSYANVDGQSVFESKPIQYHEKLRPGQSQMLCAKFSPGGMFLATGSADHHVRVYKMDRDVPYRILEVEKHTDRVDSIQWANRGVKFVSGSKDGTAVIWCYESQQWATRQLLMSTPLNGTKSQNEDSKVKLKVTMVCWNADDSRIITSVNDNTIKIWDPHAAKLVNVLKIHKDEVYVLENHPEIPRVMLSAGHDGAVHLWDIQTGEILSSYQNHIEGQGNGAVFDAKWSPDGTMIAATDAHGHILIFGLAPLSEKMQDVPKELFFHTDYRPILRDAVTDQVIDEQTQVPPHLMPPPFLVDIEGTPYPPTFQRLVPGRENCTNDQLTPNIIFTPGGQQEVIDGDMGEARSNIDQMIRVLAGTATNARLQNTVSPRSRPRGGEEGVRQSSGNWHRDGLDWKERVIFTRLSPGELKSSRRRVESLAKLELEEYDRESRRVPEPTPVVSTAPVNRQRQHRRQPPVYRTRAVRGQQLRDQVSEVNEEEPEQDTASNHGDTSDVNSDDMSSESSSDSSSTEYSDWVADNAVNLEPPKRSRQRRAPPKKSPPPSPTRVVKKAASASVSTPSCSTAPIPPLPAEIPDSYKPSEWLSEVIPKKFPYYPQMGDEVMFFAQGYELYLKAVQMKRVYQLANTQYKPWGKLNLNEPELVKIIGIKYELRPPRLCCLRLAVMRPNGKLTSDRFTIKYHDIPDVIDFFVLKQTYDIAMERKWKTGDRFRSTIDDGWWWGTIESRTKSNSMFLGHCIKWDNGELEAMSPWDMEPIDYSREPEVEGGSVPVLPEEITAILYHPRGDEWPGGDRDSACQRIIAGLEEIMSLAIAEPFIAPVDINAYPTYSYIVEFTIDLSTIKARFENRFYRRVTAAQFDIRYLATNAEKFNEPHSSIVKQARIVTDLCLRLCKDYNRVDVPLLYRQLLDAYQSSESETDEPRPSTSRELPKRERAAANRSLRAMNRAQQQNPDWRRDCRQLLDVLFNCQDSEPFREPVDRLEHPDYDKVIDTPMDLGTVREELLGGNYSNPVEFCKDVRMIFSNSRSYNTNKRSRIYVMTVRLAAMAEEHMKRIMSHWKSSLRRQHRDGQSKTRKKPAVRKRRKKKSSESENSDTESEDEDSDYRSNKKSALNRRKKKPASEAYDKNVHGESSGARSNGLRSRTVSSFKRPVQVSSESDSDGSAGPSSVTPPLSKARVNGNAADGYRTMNGHIRVLRPVRRAAQNSSTAHDQSLEESDDDVEVAHGKAFSSVRPARQTVRTCASVVDNSDSDSPEINAENGPSGRKVMVTQVVGRTTGSGSQNYLVSFEKSSDSDSSEVDAEVVGNNANTMSQAVDDHVVVYQRNGHASELESDDSDDSDKDASVNVEQMSEESDSSDEGVEQKVIVVRNPTTPARGVKRRRPSDSDYSARTEAAPRTLRAVKRRNYAPSNDSDNDNARPRRSQTAQNYEDDSDSTSKSSCLQQPRNRARHLRTRVKTYKEQNSEEDEEEKLQPMPSRGPARRSRTAAPTKCESESASESEEDYRPVTMKRQTARTSFAKSQLPSDDENDVPNLSVSSRGRARKSLKANHNFDQTDSEESSDAPTISISSRGRVRKITARARAFLRD